MEGNIKIIDKLIEQYGVEATQQAKEAMVNFAVLFGEKLVRACTVNRQGNKKVTGEDIRSAYEITKMLHSPEYEAELQERKKNNIVVINSSILFGDEDDPEEKGEKAARSAVTVKLYNSEIHHMSLGKEQQLTYE